MNFPADWVSNTDQADFMIFATSQKAIDADEPGATDAVTLLARVPVTEFETTDPEEALNTFIPQLGFQESELREGPTAVTLNGVPAATAIIDAESNSGIPLTAYITVLIDDPWAAIFVATTPIEMEADYQDIFIAMAESIELSAPLMSAASSGMMGAPETEGFLFYGDVVEGVLKENSQTAWSFIGLEGEKIDILVEPASDDLDLTLDILDETGKSILGGAIDDSFGVESLTGFELTVSGSYFIVINSYDGSPGDFTLTLAEAGTAATDEGEDDRVRTVITSGSALNFSEFYKASLDGATEATFTFPGKANEFADVTVSPLTEGLDVVIDLLDPSGASLLPESPLDDSYDTEYLRIMRLPVDGQYTIVVSSYDGAPGDFELLVEESYLNNPASFIFASGSLDDAEEAHDFPFYTYTDEMVIFQVNPAFELDAVVQLYNDDTGELLQEKDASTGFEEVIFLVPEDGNYKFKLIGYEGSTGAYDVTLIGSEFVYFELAVGDLVIGRFGSNSLFEYYIGGAAGDTVNLTIKTEDSIDLILELTDFDSNILASADEGGVGAQETLSYTFESDDLLILRVSDFTESGTGEFILSVE